eukprot:TRINITY_DN39568_c0_g1_i1.p1 TRINITY_DN39568_c0_g1~~TRINITY_DN39568_c0_g1_i1.p1  ORF type:complete len:179 (+),score=21.79 TRINITY_DN39568_c0_g1_i1:177-713(+)
MCNSFFLVLTGAARMAAREQRTEIAGAFVRFNPRCAGSCACFRSTSSALKTMLPFPKSTSLRNSHICGVQSSLPHALFCSRVARERTTWNNCGSVTGPTLSALTSETLTARRLRTIAMESQSTSRICWLGNVLASTKSLREEVLCLRAGRKARIAQVDCCTIESIASLQENIAGRLQK